MRGLQGSEGWRLHGSYAWRLEACDGRMVLMVGGVAGVTLVSQGSHRRRARRRAHTGSEARRRAHTGECLAVWANNQSRHEKKKAHNGFPTRPLQPL